MAHLSQGACLIYLGSQLPRNSAVKLRRGSGRTICTGPPETVRDRVLRPSFASPEPPTDSNCTFFRVIVYYAFGSHVLSSILKKSSVWRRSNQSIFGCNLEKKRCIPNLKLKFELKMMSDKNKNKIGIEKIPNIL